MNCSIVYNNLQRQEELNNRISVRNVPSGPMQPYYGMRGVQTRHIRMPIVDGRVASNTVIQRVGPHDVEQTFNPGTATAPWHGYADNVDTETVLRGTIFPLQSNPRAHYVPSSGSDLYTERPTETSQPVTQTNPLLFKEQHLEMFNPNPHNNVGNGLFENHTRQQTKNIK